MSIEDDDALPRRLPAQYGREALRRLARWWLAAMAGAITIAVAVGASAGWRSWEFVAAELSFLAGMWAIHRWVEPGLDRREQGNNGEIKVGTILDGLEDRGWRTLHDVQTGRGNIDHLVVGPGGILTVETKSRRGMVQVDRIDPKWLRQAYAQRKWIEKVTSEPADSLLVFSDAYLDRFVSRRRGVCVMPARALPGHLARRPARLTPDRVDSIYERLARALD